MKSKNILVAVLLTLSFLMFSVIAYLSEGSEGGEDSFMHYLFAAYAFQHPENLLDHWAKPLFVLLCSPFAQFGFTEAKIFNILCGVLTAFITYKTAEKLNLKVAVAAIIILLFSPLYFITLPSSLTEIVFSLVLAAGIYFFVSGKYYWAAFILSFLPFARTEGFVILPVVGLFLLWKKQWLLILLLGSAFILYSIAGYFVFKDILWIIHRNPYTGAADVYHSGDFWHYWNSYRDIVGDPLKWLFIFGALSMFIRLNRITSAGLQSVEQNFPDWLLIWACGIAYWAAHSYVWSKGLAGSLGLIRVMAGILPLVALICTKGLDSVARPFILMENFRLALIFTILFFVVQVPFEKYKLPIELGKEEQLIKKAGAWYLQSPGYNDSNKIYYFAPTTAIAFHVDPFDFNKRGYLDDAKTPDNVKTGSLVVYDTHFGPNECHIPLDSIKSNPDYELIQKFNYDFELRTLNNYIYEVYLFRRK